MFFSLELSCFDVVEVDRDCNYRFVFEQFHIYPDRSASNEARLNGRDGHSSGRIEVERRHRDGDTDDREQADLQQQRFGPNGDVEQRQLQQHKPGHVQRQRQRSVQIRSTVGCDRGDGQRRASELLRQQNLGGEVEKGHSQR